jgi:hypothetical protein
MAAKIEATLAERGSRYGDYAEHARITQNIKRAMQDSPNWARLADDMREALEMIAHKAGRILNGDPAYHDSWHDIIGYTKLVADRLEPSPVSVYHAIEAPMPPLVALHDGDDEPERSLNFDKAQA